MRMKTFLITLNWFANETVYLGLSYYGPSLGTNPPLSFFLSSLVELPSYVLCWYVMDRFGRRWPMCLLMILGGISCVITVLLPENSETETLILYLISKSMICGSFLIIYPFAGELYPTQARGVGIGFSSYVGGLGLIIIPFITYLGMIFLPFYSHRHIRTDLCHFHFSLYIFYFIGKEKLSLPLFIMGWLVIAGGFTALRLPETLHQRLPQTLEEGEEFGKDWSMKDCTQCDPNGGESSTSGSSYEAFARENEDDVKIEMSNQKVTFRASTKHDERTPLDGSKRFQRRQTMRKLKRQQSVMDTQKTGDLGAMQLTYWF
jgi:MFS family permease